MVSTETRTRMPVSSALKQREQGSQTEDGGPLLPGRLEGGQGRLFREGDISASF